MNKLTRSLEAICAIATSAFNLASVSEVVLELNDSAYSTKCTIDEKHHNPCAPLWISFLAVQRLPLAALYFWLDLEFLVEPKSFLTTSGSSNCFLDSTYLALPSVSFEIPLCLGDWITLVP